MQDSDKKLTEEERILVEKNHDLIYTVMDCMDLDSEEYYGLFAIALCRAAQKYKTRYRAYSFEEFAKIIMIREYYIYKYCNPIY